jgi:hypothetical protein
MMPSTGTAGESKDADSAELREAGKIVAEALSRLGRGFDPASDGDLDCAIQYVSDLMAADPASYDKLVVMLLKASVLASKSTADSEKSRHVNPLSPMRIYSERTSADEFLMDDPPSRGRLLSALDTVARVKGIAKR